MDGLTDKQSGCYERILTRCEVPAWHAVVSVMSSAVLFLAVVSQIAQVTVRDSLTCFENAHGDIEGRHHDNQ